jgi:DNA-binding MarR family transcriptional regulator
VASKGEFASALRRLVRGVGRLERDVVCCEVTLQQFDTLRLLCDGARLNTDLAQALGIDLSTASRNLAKLEAGGYVERVPVAEDGRATANRLTRKGKRCLETLVCDERLVLGALLNRLPSERRDAAVGLLAELAAAVDAEVEAKAPACVGCEPKPRRARSGNP